MTLKSLKETVADLLDVDPAELTEDAAFDAYADYDSLKVVLLMAALEEDFGLNVPPAKAWELNSIRDIVAYAREKGVTIEDS